MTTPVLSICVPSRNRQAYFRQTILALLENPRRDVEFVFADNSDRPEIMNAFMAGLDDARIRYLPSAATTLSMQDNWERTVGAATGDWVSVIGDDDHLDPDAVDAIQLALRLKPDMDAFAWKALPWNWPVDGAPLANIAIPMAPTLHDMPKSLLMRRAFRWDDATALNAAGFSIYHSAISRRLVEAIHARFNHRHFEHPVVDYESTMKVVSLGKSFVFCQRPLSIAGVCPESNSACLYDQALMKKRHAEFMADLGRNYDDDPWLRDFPFPSTLGPTAAIGVVQQWFRATYGVTMDGWERGFARACAHYCNNFRDRDDFAIAEEGFRAAFARWKGGRFRADFAPEFRPLAYSAVYTGMLNGNLYVESRIGDCASPGELWKILNALLVRPAELEPVLHSHLRDAAR